MNKNTCDKCKKNKASVSYTETVNSKTRHLRLCSKCANLIIGEREQFMNSFFNLDPFREMNQMFDSMLGNAEFEKHFSPSIGSITKGIKPKQKTIPHPQPNTKEEKLKTLKAELDKLKQEEAIAVMLQDYLKAAEIKKKREKIQKEAEKIVYGK